MDKANESATRIYRGYLFTVIYLCAVVLVAFTGMRIGLSHYYAAAAVARNSDSDAANAVFYAPANPEAYKSRGMVGLRNENFSDAATNFQRAVELRDGDFLLWLRLGDAQSKLRNFDAARTAYQNALSLAPNYAQPNKHMGLMLLDMGAPDEAFTYLSNAAEHNNSLYPEILELARNQYPGNPEAMERAINPHTLEARKVVALYLIKNDFMTDAVKTLLTENELSDAEKDEFIRHLINKKNLRVAHEVWLTKSAQALAKPADNDPISDGGFERITESDDSGFGWQVDQHQSEIAVAIDNTFFHTGSRSLRVKFAGRVEPGRKIISQLVILKPNQNYQLSFAVFSSELTSGGLPIVVVNTGNSATTQTRSALVKVTDDKWVTLTVDFKTNEESTALISLQRAHCDANPCPIFGELWLDDFSIKEIR